MIQPCVYAFVTLFFIVTCESARILAIFPVPSISHQVVFRPITQGLARNGHEVVVMTPDPVFTKTQPPANLTEIDVHDISYKIFREILLKMPMGSKGSLATQMDGLVKVFSDVFEEQIKTEGMQKIINNKMQKFDLLLIEACVKPALSFSHIFKAPVILVSSLGQVLDNNNVIGVPNHPTRYPALRQRLYNLTVWEKFSEFKYYWDLMSIIQEQEEKDNVKLRKYFGQDMPTLTELGNNVEMLFLNLNQIWAGNYPVPPSVIFMGGLHQKPKLDLPKDLQASLDSSKNGVIYFSLGTNFAPLSKQQLQIFVNVFSKLPYDVYWIYYHEAEFPELTENIKIFKFLPQSDLLRHPKIKLFITQGGIQSTDEAITAGVPMVGLPMLADQWYNVEQFVFHGIGKALDIETLNEKDLMEAIKTVIEDKSYRDNIKNLRTLILDQPQKPLERALWYIEHVLRHKGARHLRSPVANMSLAEFIELDMIVVAVVILLAMLVMAAAVLYKAYRILTPSVKEKKN
ncbi:UDP-glucosyltransferase 2-like [Aricia agestis]|uniref:UDP-glucosyltransferase 2-like n=1 Tax=Aricia agestis TaxID=91739 RepID=UPI001C20C272|nr:UDP-glucosyltransferase 2-like [Aricia agestis]